MHVGFMDQICGACFLQQKEERSRDEETGDGQCSEPQA